MRGFKIWMNLQYFKYWMIVHVQFILKIKKSLSMLDQIKDMSASSDEIWSSIDDQVNISSAMEFKYFVSKSLPVLQTFSVLGWHFSSVIVEHCSS